MTNQVTSIEQSKRLLELGVPAEMASMVWDTISLASHPILREGHKYGYETLAGRSCWPCTCLHGRGLAGSVAKSLPNARRSVDQYGDREMGGHLVPLVLPDGLRKR